MKTLMVLFKTLPNGRTDRQGRQSTSELVTGATGRLSLRRFRSAFIVPIPVRQTLALALRVGRLPSPNTAHSPLGLCRQSSL